MKTLAVLPDATCPLRQGGSNDSDTSRQGRGSWGQVQVLTQGSSLPHDSFHPGMRRVPSGCLPDGTGLQPGQTPSPCTRVTSLQWETDSGSGVWCTEHPASAWHLRGTLCFQGDRIFVQVSPPGPGSWHRVPIPEGQQGTKLLSCSHPAC
jgi:hypothetical protein